MTHAQFLSQRITDQEVYIAQIESSDRSPDRKLLLSRSASEVKERFENELFEIRRNCKCEWIEEYYGVRCKHCDMFYPHGGAPWEDMFDGVDNQEEESAYRTCDTCGGESGDGWTSCTCDVIGIMEWLQDFDNSELSDYDRAERLREAVIQYNEENGTMHIPDATVKKYKQTNR